MERLNTDLERLATEERGAGPRWVWLLAGCLLTALVLRMPSTPPTGRATERIATAAELPDAAGLPMAAEPAARQPLTEENPPGWTGVVVPDQTVEVAAEESGRLVRVFHRVGDRVRAGEPLAELDGRALEERLASQEAVLRRTEAEEGTARLAVARAEREEQRRRRLADILSEEELERAAFETRAARASLEAAIAEHGEAQTRAEGLRRSLELTKLRAPVDGFVAERFLDPGSWASAGAPILRLTGENSMLRFAVPTGEAEGLAPGLTLWVESRDGGPAATASVLQRAPGLDVASRMVFVEAAFEGAVPKHLRVSGTVVRVTLRHTEESSSKRRRKDA